MRFDMNLNKSNLINHFIYIIFVFLVLMLQVSPATASIKIVECNEKQIIIEAIIPPAAFAPYSTENNQFESVFIEDFVLSNRPGRPRLPMKGMLLTIPPTAKYRLQILESNPQFLAYKNIPSAAPLQISEKPSTKNSQLDFDPLIYKQNRFYPHQWAEITSEQVMRNKRIIRVQINPVHYNPQTHELINVTYLKLVIRFTLPKTAPKIIQQRPQLENRYFNSIFKNTILNNQQSQRWQVAPVRRTERFQAVQAAVPASSPQYKIMISQNGIFRLTYNWLQSQGVDLSLLNPATVKIKNKGREIPLFIQSAEETRFSPGDFIQFYGQPNLGDSSYFDPFSDMNVYWLMYDDTPGLRFQPINSRANPTRQITETIRKIHLEEENKYHAGDTNFEIIETEQVHSEGWIWRFLYGGDSYTVPLPIQQLPKEPRLARIQLRFHGTTIDQANPDHHIQIELNQQLIGDYTFDNRQDLLVDTTFSTALLKNGDNSLKIKSLDDLGASLNQVYLDWINFEIPAKLETGGATFHFRNPAGDNEVGQFSIWGFPEENVQIFEINRGKYILPHSFKQEIQCIFQVASAGYNAGYFTRIEINNQVLVNPGKRGINVATVDAASGQPIDILNFDTYASTEEADSLARFINTLAPGTYVLAGIRDEGSARLNEAAKSALESIGSQYIRNVGSRDSWAIIGQKGAEIGSVPENHQPDGEGVATVIDSVIIENAGDKFHLLFSDSLDQPKEYFIVTPESCKTPQSIKLDTVTNYAGTNHGADYIIITHSKFKDSANRLAQYYSTQKGLRVEVVYVAEIFDEFNFGITHPAAIKAFLQFTYENWQPPAPSVVTFFGDASWDAKMNSSTSVKTDFVPSYGNPVSDSWFVCFDGPEDFHPEMITGRVAVETTEAAENYVDKIIGYSHLKPQRWQKDVLFITGGFNAYEQTKFMRQSTQLSEDFVQAPPAACRSFMITKTTDGRFEGENKPEILAAINNGKLWINFLGHAGSRTWDLMFNKPDVLELENEGKYPFISSMTCHTGRFANPEIDCFGELFVNQPQKGAIAFWGTSGWGYIEQDYILLQKLFPTILADTIQALGAATQIAKLNLWEIYGGGNINKNTIQQYHLIGDPLTEIALSKLPDLTIEEKDILFEPAVPVEADSLVCFKIKLSNWGLAAADSVKFQITDLSTNQNIPQPGVQYKVAPLGHTDSITVIWPIRGQAGEHRLRFSIDPDNEILESNEENNSQILPIFIYSSSLTISKPVKYQVVNQRKTYLQINTPITNTADSENKTYEFEIDSVETFDSPLFTRATVAEGKIVTRWQTPELIDGVTYFWRCRLQETSTIGKWVQSSFSVDLAFPEFGVNITDNRLLKESEFYRTDLQNGGVQLSRHQFILEVQSGGYADGNLGRIYINKNLIMEAGRGFNVAVIDSTTGEILITETFDVWKYNTAADSLALLFNALESGLYVCVAVKDEASTNLTENAYLALESIGSQYCRSIGRRDSWAIIGIKGAPIGSVPESYQKTETGSAAVTDTLNLIHNYGFVESPVLGPANSWKDLQWLGEYSVNRSKLSCEIIGFNPVTTQWDTISSGLTNSTGIDLSIIDSTIYSRIKIRTLLESLAEKTTPTFNGWKLQYHPVADLATNKRVFSSSADSVLEGSTITISTEVHNVGLSVADSVQVKFSQQLPGNERQTIHPLITIPNLPVDSMRTVQVQWQAAGKFEQTQIFIELDPAGQVRELFNFNNAANRPIYVTGDSTRPELKVTFDGNEISDGSWVTVNPNIEIQIHDNSHLAYEDTARIQLLLDDENISFSNNSETLALHSAPITAESTLRGTVVFRPTLTDGSHLLEIIISDASQNGTYYRKSFEVVSEFKIQSLLNYPNPFQQETNFTYIFTQPADFVKLEIFTIAGRLIRTLEYAPSQIGFNRLFWDGRDAEQDKIANGVYLYKITAKVNEKRYEQIQKLIRMK